MNRARFVPVLIAAAVFSACSKEPSRSSGGGSGTPVGSRYTMPALLASVGEKTGTLAKINLRFERAAARDKPVSCALIEELPGSSGESMRMSLHLAATVAALQHGDDLSGVEILVEVPGKVEGPSMGALMTLTIMSALDGRQLPDDFAMTGAILPDGGVGYVTDLVHKIEAAKAAGVSRVLIPGAIRFDKDPKTGAEVDLKKRAAELGIELVPVDTVAEAYAAVHKLPAPAEAGPANAAALPDGAENFFKKLYEENQKAGDALWAGFTDAQRDAIGKEPLLRANLVELPARARTAWRTGRVIFAAEAMRKWAVMLKVQKEVEEFYGAFKGATLDEVAGDVTVSNAALSKAHAALIEEIDLLRDIQKSSTLVGAQFCADISESRGYRTNFGLYQEKITPQAIAIRATTDEAKRIEAFRQILAIQRLQLFCQKTTLALAQSAAADAKSLSTLTSPLSLQSDPQRLGRLLFGAYYSSQRQFFALIVRPNATAMKTTDEGAMSAITSRDPVLAPFGDINLRLQKLNNALRDGAQDNFVHAAAAHLYAGGIATMHSHIARWSDFDPIVTTTPISFRRTDLISDLLTHARATALAAIAQCKARSIPAYQALYHFEIAEVGRDDPAEDKPMVLCNYWRASLQAKLLLMLYAPRK
jgi:hypothetical protein